MGTEPVVMDERGIVFEYVCRERHGEVVRTVKPTFLNLEKLRDMWNRLKDFDVLFNDYVRGDFNAFINHFLVQVDGEILAAGLMWDVDDVGMFYLNDIRPAASAAVHFVFWDRVFTGREELCREGLRRLFKEFHFQRLQAEVPLYAQNTMAAVERIGFIQEGRIRRAVPYKGDWFDLNIYSVLPEDLENIPEGVSLSSWRNRRLLCWGCGEQYEGRYGFPSEAHRKGQREAKKMEKEHHEHAASLRSS
jgi:RimJ/RimL family protein N-acetyltransferase